MLNFRSLLVNFTCVIFTISMFGSSQAAEVSMPGLSGNFTNTITSGFSMRVAERDCMLIDGYNSARGAVNAKPTLATMGRRLARGEDSTLDAISGGSTFGCAISRSDDYGNTTEKVIDIGNSNTNDGNLNFDQGSIFLATQNLYSSFSGVTDGGLGLDFSFTAAIDPTLDINAPAFKEFTTKAKDAFESDVSLLDFYISGSENIGNNYVDFTIGKTVTSWGEATFIPVGMNGLVTNPLDLSKLTSPSSGIREALIPVETLSLATGLPDGSSLEAYYQFKHHQVGIPAAGSYFGSETFGPGTAGLIATGANRYESLKPESCPGLMTARPTDRNRQGNTVASYGFNGSGLACNSTTIAAVSHNKTSNTYQAVNTLDLAIAGLKQMNATSTALSIGVGKAHEFVTGDSNSAGVIAANTGSAANIAGFLASAAALEDPIYENAATVHLRPTSSDGLYKEPKDDGQYGFKWSKYLDDVGTGLDVSFSYANYHSKVPYIQFSMPGNFFASDALGAYLLSSADAAGTAGVFAGNAAGTFELAGTENIYKALINAGMSSGICGAVTKTSLAQMHGYGASPTNEEKEMAMMAAYHTELDDGTVVYNSHLCLNMALGNQNDADDGLNFTSIPDFAASTGVRTEMTYDEKYKQTAAALGTALIGTGARLFAAVTPISFIDYRGIFPEDLQVFALSGSTNVGGTTVQAELAYRPNFPLATGAGNQINQLNDKNGANDALNMVSVAGINAANAAGLALFQAGVCTAVLGTPCAATAPFYTGLGAYERSDLGNVLDANGNETTDLTSRYYSKPYIEYDVLSGTIGTTTSFNASSPVTVGLGADSSVFLTEVGFVRIQDLNNSKNGHVARGGWNEGVAAGTTKCLGAFGSSYENLRTSTAALTNIGSGVVDALFGNGGYCESKPGADDMSLTYRLIGSATYNNINNSQWSLSPNFAWSHDAKGYGPTSLGGFIEGRQSLSIGASLNKNDLRISTSYTDYLGDELSQLNGDKDFLSLAVSYAF